MRAVIANDLALGVGKELGITKAEIKKRLAKKVNKRHNRIMWRHYPIGFDDWLYVEKTLRVC